MLAVLAASGACGVDRIQPYDFERLARGRRSAGVPTSNMHANRRFPARRKPMMIRTAQERAADEVVFPLAMES